MNKIVTLAAISCTAVALTACGDDVTNVTENNVGVQSFESFKKFPDCTKENQGEMAMSKKDGKLYYCVDSSWVQMVAESTAGENGENGSDGKDGNDGVNGKDGSDGENGKDGTSCTAKETKKGIEISCGDKIIGILTNGKDGKPGKDGEDGKPGNDGEDGENGIDGKNCEITDKGDGVLEIKCGDKTEKIYKAMCSANPYEPEISFCFDGEIYDKCGGESYNVKENLCVNEKLYPLCDGKEYEVDKKFCDTRNNKTYNYVTIGEQVWMAENLNYDTLTSYCYEDKKHPEDIENCKTYGRLYSWASAMGKSEEECGIGFECGVTDFPHQGVCPSGWHLPTMDEWNSLKTFLGADAGKQLKSTEGWYDDGNGNDVYGFSALPAGHNFEGDSYQVGDYAKFWSASEDNSEHAYTMEMDYYHGDLVSDYSFKDLAYSVRCLMD